MEKSKYITNPNESTGREGEKGKREKSWIIVERLDHQRKRDLELSEMERESLE